MTKTNITKAEAKILQGYKPTATPMIYANCRHLFTTRGTWLRCGLGNFKVLKYATCDEFIFPVSGEK